MRTVNIRTSIIEAAEEEIRSIATELELSHTLGGEWGEGCDDIEVKKHHDYLVELADRLAKAVA